MTEIPDGKRTGASTSDEVRSTYYGLPVIKPPHWRWLVIGYFFLGGIAGGSYVIGAVTDLVRGDRAVVRAARYLSFAALVPSPVLLILDLGRPDRFLNMFRVLKLKSPLSVGSFALATLGMFSGALFGLQALEDLTRRSILRGPSRVLELAGIPFGMFVTGYTGVLLEVTNVPFWARFFPFLGPTFVGSAFSTSLAAISGTLALTGTPARRTTRQLARLEVIALLTEIGMLTAGLTKAGKLGRPLTAGTLGRIFWPVTGASGLLSPLLLLLRGPVRGKERKGIGRLLPSFLALVGGFSLRTLMIFAGRKSASSPEDYFELTRRRNP